MTLKVILITLGVILLIESIMLIFITEGIGKILREIIKSKKTIKNTGYIELIIGIIVLFIGLSLS